MTPKLRPTTSDAPKGESARLSPSKSIPATSTSKSLGASPRSQSRTPPPTRRGRPERRTLSSIARRSSGRAGAPSISGLRYPPSGREGRRRGKRPSGDERDSAGRRDGPEPAGASEGEPVEGAGKKRGAGDPQTGRPRRASPPGSRRRPQPSRKPQQGGGMHKLEADRGLPGIPHARGLQGRANGVRAQQARGYAGGPEDPRPSERGAMMHGADRCKFRDGTKAQNRG